MDKTLKNDDDFEVEYYPDPAVFENENMRILHQEQFDKFVEFRVRGISSNVAFAKAFPRYARPGDFRAAMERVTYLEGTDWYIEEFEKRLAAKTAHELWPANTAINRLLQRIEDPAEKGAVRVMAIKELNVLTGVTVIDEKGNTRAGRSLEDFYKSAPTNEALAKGAADVAIPAAANPAAAKAREAANGTKLH